MTPMFLWCMITAGVLGWTHSTYILNTDGGIPRQYARSPIQRFIYRISFWLFFSFFWLSVIGWFYFGASIFFSK